MALTVTIAVNGLPVAWLGLQNDRKRHDATRGEEADYDATYRAYVRGKAASDVRFRVEGHRRQAGPEVLAEKAFAVMRSMELGPFAKGIE